jgi:hypothetical protein
LIEIPNMGMQTLTQMLQARSWDAAVVVSLDDRSEAALLAKRLNIPLLRTPTRDALLACDKIVIAEGSEVGIETVRAMVAGSPIAVIPFAEAVAEIGEIATVSISVIRGGNADQEDDTQGGFQGGGRACFDGRILLGLGPVAPHGTVELDVGDPRVTGILERVVHRTGATTGSIMLMDADGEHLRVATALGSRAREILGLRLRPGEGIAGRAYATGQRCSAQQPVAVMAESPDSASTRIALSVPIILAGRPVGVLSVNTESTGEVDLEPIVRNLEQHAKAANRALLGAIRLDHADGERREMLRRLVDRIMSLEETLPIRISCIAEAMGKAVHAGNCQLYLLDLQSNRFHKVNPDSGLSIGREASQSADRGLLGWIIRNGKPRIVEMSDEETEDRIVVAYIPLRSFRSPAILVFEDCRIAHAQVRREVELLTDVIHLVEEILAVEENVADRDFVSELEMRIADEAEDLDGLNPEERTHALLNLAVSLLAADAALWIQAPGATPIIAPIAGTACEALGDLAEERVGEVEAWTRKWGSVAGGSAELDARPGAPISASSYAGAVSQDGTGVLIVYFSPDDTMGTFVQVPTEVLCLAIERLCERIASRSGKQDGVGCAPQARPKSEPMVEVKMESAPPAQQVLETPPIPEQAFEYEPGAGQEAEIERTVELTLETTLQEDEPRIETVAEEVSGLEEAGDSIGGFGGIAPVSTKILIIGSGAARAGVLWENVERIGTVSMRSTPRTEPGQTSADVVSLGALLQEPPGIEKHLVVLREDGEMAALSCEHIGGLIPFAAQMGGQTPPIRVIHAAEVRRFLGDPEPSREGDTDGSFPAPLRVPSGPPSISSDVGSDEEMGDSDDRLRRAG